ncbi:hypothetical protein SynPROS71_00127 [Synechococcus sp. PROS-7-1]|nr:hypothetical protein SynPROS71_00127 [Synechococcus sp. PROS-7-1]
MLSQPSALTSRGLFHASIPPVSKITAAPDPDHQPRESLERQ